MADQSTGVTLVALQTHIGYGYFGGASTLLVNEGDTFTTTTARAARLLAKGIAKLDVSALATEPPLAAEGDDRDVSEPVKIDGRTKAGKAHKGHRQ